MLYGIIFAFCVIESIASNEPLYMIAAAMFNIGFEISNKKMFKLELYRGDRK